MEPDNKAISWHSQPVESVVSHLETRLDSGLTASEAGARLLRDGPNDLREHPRPPFWKLVLEQL
ncbi:MAG: cation-transporting P-type ATPase, partial [Anaerolineae bacterium]